MESKRRKKTEQVPKVILGKSGIRSSRLGIGFAAWPLTIPYEQVVMVVDTALRHGVRHIDTAALYATEDIVGRALKDAEAPEDTVVSTKVCSYKDDIGVDYREYSADTVYASVERSLRRLRVESVDIVHLHDVEPQNLKQIFSKEGALHGLMDLKSQGVVKSIGMATYHIDCLQKAVDSGDIDHIQLFHSYTLLNQSAMKALIPAARGKNITVINTAPFAGFILATGSGEHAQYNYRPASSDIIDTVRRLEKICEKKGVTLQAAALAFSCKEPKIDVTVIGTRSPERIREYVKAFSAPLESSDFAKILTETGNPHFELVSPYKANPCYSFPWPDPSRHGP